LNETCKDAITLDAFLEEIEIKEEDLKYCRDNGFVKSTCNILLKKLSQYGIHERPLHCTDLKRETLYIKEEANWEKDNLEKTKFKKALGTVVKKNIQQITEWQKKYPEYNDPASRQNDKYLKMLCNAMNGSTDDEQEKNMEKIIRNITKEVIIDKN
jgi:hypothetical protein